VVAAQQEVENKEGSMTHDTAVLPSDKLHHAFISHKKKHTTLGDSSETMALRLKVYFSILCICMSTPPQLIQTHVSTQDVLRYEGISAFMDCDDLSTISKNKLEEAIVESCCVLVVLNDETLSSDWCRVEVRD
jgi:hypothetical protein